LQPGNGIIKKGMRLRNQLSLLGKLRIARLITTFLAVLSLLSSSSPAEEKITVEDLLAKHLESMGTAKARASVTTRIISGTSLVIFRSPPPGQAPGRVVLASQDLKSLLGMRFQNPVYPREEFGFNGSSFVAAYVTPGMRSPLGEFLMTHDVIFKEGLLAGTLSSAWPLLNLTARRPRLEYAGTKKIDGRIVHELKYLPHGGSDLKIGLFFDDEMFRHVRTIYERVIPAPTGERVYTNVEERDIRYKMVENFSDFKNEGGLILPHTYKIELSVDSKGGTFLAEWQANLTQFTFNERIDPASFSIAAR
jgi:hypothetical protein